jgi:hypothetical protein
MQTYYTGQQKLHFGLLLENLTVYVKQRFAMIMRA